MSRAADSEETLQKVMERYSREGYKGQFGARAGGRVRCFSCSKDMDPALVRLEALHRFEGASDPGDEMAAAALVCPACGAKGTIAMSFGPSASIEDKLVLKELMDKRHKAKLHSGV
ncbi:MAG TPA: hypothetical protein VM286_02075 [Candidatus Thermoplasmatota archaeon]|nr:hypothetical protein [Candidatus Thermoplasmatota archaeon]